MDNDRTRTFEAVYTDNNQRQHHLVVRVFNRFAIFGLTILLLRTGIALTQDAPEEKMTATSKYEDMTFQEDKELIEKIIAEKPHILKNVIDITYTIEPGDTLTLIAGKNATTVETICAQNGLNKDDMIYAGGTIKIEKLADKSEVDETIAALESYFYDYMFKSPVVVSISRENVLQTEQAGYYRSLIFGSPKSEADVDPMSIYGRYITSYIAFHNGEEHSRGEKEAYMTKLADLAVTAEDELNLGGSAQVIVPFEQYKGFLKNGTTKEPAHIVRQ